MFYILLLFLVVAVFIVRQVFPIISGYGAKTICSNIFICDRPAEEVIENELSSFPLNLGKYSIDMQEQSVTGTVFGLAKRKAVFREGLGATLINNPDEQDHLSFANILQTTTTNHLEVLDWPHENRINTTSKSADKEQLHIALEEAFNDDTGKRGTRAVIIVHDGEIVAERYAAGFTEKSKLAGWSLAKSITSALIGILVKKGALNIHEPVPIEEWEKDQRRSITIADLLHMSSGLQWWEYYATPSDATNMLYKEKNMGAFALNKKLKNKTGTKFNYSSGSTNILCHIIRKTVDEYDYYHFPYKELLHKISMNEAVLEVDESGTFVGSSYCFATARDWARFGLLYLNDGIWNGERILPEGWVEFTTTASNAISSKKEGSYGAHWWLNSPTENNDQRHPSVPADCFFAKGYEGQYIWVIPSKKLVVVRLASEKGNQLDPNVFLPAVIKAF